MRAAAAAEPRRIRALYLQSAATADYAHNRAIRVCAAQPRGDLLRAPLQLQLRLHLSPQPGICQQLTAARAARPLPRPGMRQITVIDAQVMRAHVPEQLLAHRRW